MMKVEIWLRGKKLCETNDYNPAIRELEQIVLKAGYVIETRGEDGKIIKKVQKGSLKTSLNKTNIIIKGDITTWYN